MQAQPGQAQYAEDRPAPERGVPGHRMNRYDDARTMVVRDVLAAVTAELTAQTGRARLDIIDAGGGTGGFAVPLAAAGHTVTVIDPSPDSLAAAQRRAAEMAVPLRAVQGDATDLAALAGGQGADLVLCHSVLEYVDSPAAAMAAVASVLRPGGAVSVLASQRGRGGAPPGPGRPLRRGQAAARRGRGAERAPGAGLPPPRRFTLAEVIGLIEEAGLRPGPAHGIRVFSDLVPGSFADATREPRTPCWRWSRPPRCTRPSMTSRPSSMSSDSAEPATAADRGCHILHVDMDAFYASVELRDRPELAGQPVIVGATSSRGVVLSASYEARAFGVRSAMPVTRARRLCPQAIFIPPAARQLRRRLPGGHGGVPVRHPGGGAARAGRGVPGRVRGDPAARPAGPDRPADPGHDRRAAGHHLLGRGGVAASSWPSSPRPGASRTGCWWCPPTACSDFLHPLPVSALWGVGEQTGQVLARLGLRTVRDIAQIPVATLQRELGPAAGAHLAALAWGRDERPVVSRVPEKSIGAEETFPSDVDDPEVIRRELLRLSGRTARGLRSADALARTVVIKLRLANFTTITRSRTLPEPTDVAQTIYSTACALYGASGLDARARLRLVGVRANGLVPASRAATQLAFGERAAGWRDAERALDQISGRFGADSVRPAALVTGQPPGPSPQPPAEG